MKEQEELNQSLLNDGFDKNHPIILWNGEILDGWNRYVGCQQTGVEPVFIGASELGIESDLDALKYVIRSNSVRRHETPGQRAAQAVRAARALAELTGTKLTIEEVAGEAGVSKRTVSRAKSLPDEELEKVAGGEKSLLEALDEIAPQEESPSEAQQERPERAKPKMGRVDSLLADIARLEAENADLRAEREVLLDRLKSLEEQSGSDTEVARLHESLRTEIRNLKGQINMYLRDINELKKENQWLKQRNATLSPR